MALDQAIVVRTALALLDEVGFGGLTIRRLAERLGIKNPALYWHFKNKQDLLNRMAEAMLADAFADLAAPADSVAWPAWLASVAERFHAALDSHRDGAQVVASADMTGGTLVVILDLALRVLIEAGFADQDALGGIVTLFDYTLGATFEAQSHPAARPGASPGAGGAIDAQRLPTLAAVLAKGGAGDRGHGFQAGVRLILAGIAAGRDATPRRATIHPTDR